MCDKCVTFARRDKKCLLLCVKCIFDKEFEWVFSVKNVDDHKMPVLTYCTVYNTVIIIIYVVYLENGINPAFCSYCFCFKGNVQKHSIYEMYSSFFIRQCWEDHQCDHGRRV